jgi:hypothetical protein
MAVNGQEVDAATALPEMRTGDLGELFHTAVNDGTSLPGMFSSG